MEDDEMAGRTVDLQLDAVVRFEDWPTLAAACIAAERELVDWGPEGEERLLKDPIRCLTSLATLALQRGIPGAAVDVQSASVGYDGPDDPGWLPGLR